MKNRRMFSRRARRPRFANNDDNATLLGSPPAHKEGGEAPKGASSFKSAPHREVLPLACARARKRIQRMPARLPALHRGTSPIARLISGPGFLELPGANGRTLPGASAASTLRAGHSAGRYDAQSRPGAECVVPPAGTAPAPPSGAPSRKASLDDSMSGILFRNIIRDSRQAIVIGMGTISRHRRQGGTKAR